MQTHAKEPAAQANVRFDYEFDDGLIDDQQYNYTTYHSQCLVIESCYDIRTLQEWLDKQPRVLTRLRSHGSPSYKLPQPGPYRPIAAFMPGEIDHYLLGEKSRFGRKSFHAPYGLRKSADGLFYSTYPGIRAILTNQVIVVTRSVSQSLDRFIIKAIVQPENLAIKEKVWSAQRSQLQKISRRTGSTAIGRTGRKGSAASESNGR